MSSEPTQGKVPTATAIMEIIDASLKVAILKAGIELAVWANLATGPRTAQAIAQSERWSPTGTRMLLDALCGMGLLAKDTRGYCLVPFAEQFLLPGKPTYMGDYILADLGWDGSGQLAHAIRHNARPIARNWMTEEMAPIFAGFYAPRRAAPESGLEECAAVWRMLAIEAREGLRVLDLACGSARYSLALARQHPGVHVTLQDRRAVLEVALEIAVVLGVKDQVITLPGDVRVVDLGQNQFDLAWLGHILHFFAPQDGIALLQRVNRALVSGGRVIVNEVIADEGRCAREYPLVAALWLYGVSEAGDIYTFSELRTWLEQAGFVSVTQVGEAYITAINP